MPVHWYRVYGRLLASDLRFPELAEADPGQPAWTFRQQDSVDSTPTEPPQEVLGRQTIYSGCDATLRRTARGWSITVDDTGTFELTEECRSVGWRALPDHLPDFLRAHLLGRVLATAMHFSGSLVLHGSGVAYPGGAILFLAPKHSGKSTLALALTMAGGRLVSDDTLAVDFDGGPVVWPGVHSLRLLPDAAERLGRTGMDASRSDGKRILTDLPAEQVEHRRLPIQAVYLLTPADSIEGDRAVARRQLPAPVAAASLVGQGKVSEMLGVGEQPTLLRRAATLVSHVPVYRLAVQHALERLDEVTAQVAQWHSGAPRGARL